MLSQKIKRLALFSMMLCIFLINTRYTNADIFAERIVSHNKLSVVSLDFSARNSFNNGPLTSLFHSLGIQPTGFDLGATRVKAEGRTNFKFSLKANQTNGDVSFCNSLHIKVLSRSFFSIYSGPLSDLAVTSAFGNFDPKDFIFFVSLDDNADALKNKICEFNLDFKTYRNSPDETGGIYARRVISNVISSGSW
jgi:hypothetical protein